MDISYTILVGVISGLLSGWLMYSAARIFQKILIPWYRTTIYRGVNISGTWLFESDEYHRRRIRIEIHQAANKIIGKSTHTIMHAQEEDMGDNKKENSLLDDVRVFKIEGSIVNRLVIINGRIDDPSRIGAISGLFEVVGDGQTMVGTGVAYSATEKRIGANTFIARRINKQ